MYICVCKSVSDQRIRRLVAQGEVVTLRDLMRETGLGTCCGSCVPEARAVLASALSQQPTPALHCSPQNTGLVLSR